MHDWASPAHRTVYLAALSAIDAEAKAKAGKPSPCCPPPSV
jgi:hypothetical protein